MELLIAIIKILLGLVILYYGAEWLISASTRIAIKFNIAPLIIGLTVVAFGTSAPELAISLEANFKNIPGITIGNIVGSNICNIALILGVGALFAPLPFGKKTFRRDLFLLLFVSLLFIAFAHFNKEISRIEGITLFTILISYLYYLYKNKKDIDNEVVDEIKDEIKAQKSKKSSNIYILWGIVIISLIFLITGSDFLIKGSTIIAKKFGISETIIGLSLVAFGTSIPELATVIVAALKKHYDLIIGNAIGSCLFNILAVIGISATAKPIKQISVSPLSYLIMIALVIALITYSYFKNKISRTLGIILLSLYIFYIIFIYAY